MGFVSFQIKKAGPSPERDKSAKNEIVNCKISGIYRTILFYRYRKNMQYSNRIRNLMTQHPVRINTAKNQAKARNAAERDMFRGKKEPFDVVHYFHPKQNAHHSNDERNKDSSCVMQEFSDFSFLHSLITSPIMLAKQPEPHISDSLGCNTQTDSRYT